MRSSRQFSFFNGPSELVFVRIYGSTITGLVGPPYLHCSLLAFCAFGAFLCFFEHFYALLHAKKHSQAKIT